MKIKRNSWHYKISNFGSQYESGNDTLCWYCWRGFAKSVLALIICGTIGGYAFLLYKNPVYLVVLLFLISSLIIPTLAIYYLRKKFGKQLEMPENIVSAYLKAKKDKVCPLIEYVGRRGRG